MRLATTKIQLLHYSNALLMKITSESQSPKKQISEARTIPSLSPSLTTYRPNRRSPSRSASYSTRQTDSPPPPPASSLSSTARPAPTSSPECAPLSRWNQLSDSFSSTVRRLLSCTPHLSTSNMLLSEGTSFASSRGAVIQLCASNTPVVLSPGSSRVSHLLSLLPDARMRMILLHVCGLRLAMHLLLSLMSLRSNTRTDSRGSLRSPPSASEFMTLRSRRETAVSMRGPSTSYTK